MKKMILFRFYAAVYKECLQPAEYLSEFERNKAT